MDERPGAREDLALLRRFEPVLRFTTGEQFFPLDVAHYLQECSLWVHNPSGSNELVLDEGKLTLETLGQPRSAPFGAIHYLTFVEPLNLAELTTFLVQEGARRFRDHGEVFRAELGRLARVGYGSRLLDALFSLTLFLRGRVPGDAAAAAELTYRQMLEQSERYVYYGRVLRDGSWMALQYWFFYPFNNWRSGFYGANDHEADWEMATVYLYQEEDGELAPRWVAYASHDLQGDDLRRRWDDRGQLDLVGEHPVIYVGAGSHANYFRRGEYLTEIEIPYLAPLSQLLNWPRRIWARALRRAGVPTRRPASRTFRIPFVDYARGDGRSIGPGQPCEWSAVLLDPVPTWVSQYRGLWGYYARDPLSGENAPAGPMYNRDGSVRLAWYDPVGWCGLEKVPTPVDELRLLEQRQAALVNRRRELDAAIAMHSAEVEQVGVELAALTGHAHLAARHGLVNERLRRLRLELRELRRERAQGEMLQEALALRREQLRQGVPDDPRAHIDRLMEPISAPELRLGGVLEVWAAVSIGLLMLGLVVLLVYGRQYLVVGLAGMLGAFVFIEALFHRQIVRLISSLTIALAVVSALVLVKEFFWQIAVLAVLVAGLYLVWENIREVTG